MLQLGPCQAHFNFREVSQGSASCSQPLAVLPVTAAPLKAEGHNGPYTALELRVLAATGEAPLPRSIFASQGRRHPMVAYRALLARGHSFEAKGTCCDLDAAKPKALQCLACFSTFAISKVHVTARSADDCIPTASVAFPPLVRQQRLSPKRVFHIG